MEKEIRKIIDEYLGIYTFLEDVKEKAVSYYLKSGMNIEEIKSHIQIICNKIRICESYIQRDINPEVCNNSIIFIGPMCAGKSTISAVVQEKTGIPMLSLDDRKQLHSYYSRVR